jgi:amino acid adenylation domain-containing protein
MDDPVLGHFRVIARAHPQATAVVDGTRQLSFQDLDRRSDALALQLRRSGAGTDTVVGILVAKSAEYVTAVIGVLKAGAAFLPLDPAYPADWLARVSADAGVRHCVAAGQESDAQRLAGFRHTVLIDAGVIDPGGELPANGAPAAHRPHPGQLAYVIFTSGSTGTPKAVSVPHQGLANLLAWHRSAYGAGPGTVTTAVTEISFDASVWEILGTVCAGGTCVLVHGDERGSVESLSAIFQRHQVTTAFLPTLTAERLLAEKAWGPLRCLLVGGDLLHTVGDHDGAPVVINHFGPTEASVVATAGEVAPGTEPHIGQPLPDVTVRVLDDRLCQVPAEAVGELFVGGAGLARGYLGQPAATAESFLPDPCGAPGARMYRTGDLGRLRADGNVAFSGRKEGFVKIRGYRIGLQELEAAAESHPRVQAAAAVTVVGPDGIPVIGMCAAIGGAELTGLDIRVHLARLLPAHMLPSRFILRDRLPVTDRGKVDRKAVAADFAVPPDGSRRPPSNPIEEVLLLIWQEILGLRDIGVDDDFFELGGHSILATELTGLVQEQFDLDDLPLEVFYENATVSELGRELELMLANAAQAGAEGAR